MLDVVRRYARRRLRESGREDDVLARQTQHLAGLVEAAGSGLRSRDERRWVVAVSAEVDELAGILRRLLEGDELDAAAGIVADLYWFALWRAHSGVLGWAAQVAARVEGRRGARLPAVFALASIGAWQ